MTGHSIDSLAASPRNTAGRVSSVLTWLPWVAAGIVRRHRNAAAAEWLEELPAYLLDDIGVDRRGIEDIRRHGRPRRIAGVDIPASRP